MRKYPQFFAKLKKVVVETLFSCQMATFDLLTFNIHGNPVIEKWENSIPTKFSAVAKL